MSPVLDPATRTAPIEIEIPNPTYRLKPGMYARVGITTQTKKDALVLPSAPSSTSAVVEASSNCRTTQRSSARVQVGTEQGAVVEVLAAWPRETK